MLGLVQRAGVRVDGDGAAMEVDVVALQAGEFTPPAAGPRGGDHQQAGGRPAEAAGLVGDL
jgi:hypothetical protein